MVEGTGWWDPSVLCPVSESETLHLPGVQCMAGGGGGESQTRWDRSDLSVKDLLVSRTCHHW